MSFIDELRQVQSEADSTTARQADQLQRARDSVTTEEVDEFAMCFVTYIKDNLTSSISTRSFYFREGMFGRKSNCRYIAKLSFNLEQHEYTSFKFWSDCADQGILRPSGDILDYVKSNKYFCPYESDKSSAILCWDIPIVKRFLYRAVDMLKAEGLKVDYTIPDTDSKWVHIEIVATLPCDAQGNI